MSDTRKVPVSLEAFLKRSWPILVAGAVVVLAISGLLLYLAISGKVRRAAAQGAGGVTTDTNLRGNATSTVRRLDGVMVMEGASTLQPFAVMVENSPDARPLDGPAHANIIVEAPVEGGITRFMLVFDASSTISQIGPVRSARPYFVDWANGLNAVYAHVGGSPDALQKIASIDGFRNLDEISSGKYFWRSASRSAPHNAYTKMDSLTTAATTNAWLAGSFEGWKFLTASSTEVEAATSSGISIPYGGSFNVRWSYDRLTNAYVRYQAGFIQKDRDGVTVTSTNVVVLQTEEQVLDEEGRLKIRTTGSGPAWLFRDGKRFEIRWHRTDGGWISFEGIDGSDVLFRPGKTWISVVTSPSMAPTAQTK